MLNIEIMEWWESYSNGCDCCEPYYDLVIHVLFDGGVVYVAGSTEDAKAYILDWVVENKGQEFSLEVKTEDYPG